MSGTTVALISAAWCAVAVVRGSTSGTSSGAWTATGPTRSPRSGGSVALRGDRVYAFRLAARRVDRISPAFVRFSS